MYYIGLDIGGTNLVAGLVDGNNQIIAKAKAKTKVPFEPDDFADILAGVVKQVLKEANITLGDVPWVGVGCPGTVNRKDGVVEYANNLYVKNLPLRDLLQSRLEGKEVILENDANAAAYGEYIAGALKGSDNAIAITLGTGVGGGIIINHKVYSGSNFAGAEVGHSVIVTDGRKCTCGRNGCWESYASATGLINLTKDAMEHLDHDTAMWNLVDGDIGKVSGRTAFDAMRLGDKEGQSVVDSYVKYVGVGIVNMINIFQPDILCVGGGISNEGETLMKPIREFVDREQYAMNSKQKTVVCRAELGNDAGILGAAFLGKQDHQE